MKKFLLILLIVTAFTALPLEAQDASSLAPNSFPTSIGRTSSLSSSLPEDPRMTSAEPVKPESAEPPYHSLTHRQKFSYFTSNTFEPFTFLGAGLEAGLSQLEHDNLGFGQGAEGFGTRYGAAVGDRVSFGFLAGYALPVIFKQDPRYFRKAQGPLGQRTTYAFTRAFVARNDRGNNGFNISKIGGAFLSAAVSNAYFPPEERTVGFTLRSAGLNVGTVVGFNLLREFGPDLARKFRRKK